jgi:hypothetical protein
LCKQNAVHIRLEDEGPYGNDETRCFLLSHFSTLGIRSMSCILCKSVEFCYFCIISTQHSNCSFLIETRSNLSIYDRFPLVDGTLFCTPLKYNQENKDQIELNPEYPDQVISVSASISNKVNYIYVVCLNCLFPSSNNAHKQIACKSCNQSWKGGEFIQIGTMYKYDIFAAFPCCKSRSNCNRCGDQLISENNERLNYFSGFSEEFTCHSCKFTDFHYVRPVKSVFYFKSNMIWVFS